MHFAGVSIVALVFSTAFLVWAYEKKGNPMQGFAKVVAVIAVILSALLLIGQLYMCGSMCKSGGCKRMMERGPGMGMMHQGPGMMPGPGMIQPPAPQENAK